jgi:TrmH family RNA methyltransferase
LGHPLVRQFLRLKQGGAPGEFGAVALEGLWWITRAADAGVLLTVVFVCPPLLRGHEVDRLLDGLRDAVALEVSEKVLRRMVDRDGPDGLAAIARLRPWQVADIRLSPKACVVVADRFENPGNLGTLVRCADGAGAAGVIIAERRTRALHPFALRSSMGTVFSVPVVEMDRPEALDWLRAAGFRLMAADPGAPLSYRAADYQGRVAIVLGSERYGLPQFWRDAADVLVSIPMLGIADSLNVGHAAALLLYEALHRSGGP